MKKIIFILTLGVLFSGCATLSTGPSSLPPSDSSPAEKKELPPSPEKESPQLHNLIEEEMEAYAVKKGVVFGKADFQGLLQKRYVQLLFENIDAPEEKYQLILGEKSTDNLFSREKIVRPPEYFYVEFPEGHYRLSEVSIPVGSTMATEKLSLTFDVISDKILYIGTVKMIGTKERLKLGGVPVIKPGFHYTIEILDEREEGVAQFHEQYPNIPGEVSVQLIKNDEDILRKKGEE